MLTWLFDLTVLQLALEEQRKTLEVTRLSQSMQQAEETQVEVPFCPALVLSFALDCTHNSGIKLNQCSKESDLPED